MSRVLVTGATGFVGGRLAQRLRADGDEVVAVVRRPSHHLDDLGVEQRDGGMVAVDDPLVAEVDAIVHAAAALHEDPAIARAVNRDATGSLARHARRADIPYVYVSTTAVYDLDAVDGDVVDESAPLKSADAAPSATSSAPGWYAITKAEGEAEVAHVVEDGLTATVLRPPAVLGPGPTSTWGTRIPQHLRDGTWEPPHHDTTFTWVHIDDLVDAIVAALDRPVSDVLNVIGGATTFGAYLDALHRAIPSVPPPPEPDPAARRWTGRVDGTRLGQALGVHPHRSFEEAMTEIERWWREHQHDAG